MNLDEALRVTVFLAATRTRTCLVEDRDLVFVLVVRTFARGELLRAFADFVVVLRAFAVTTRRRVLVVGEALRDVAFVRAERVEVFLVEARAFTLVPVFRDLIRGEAFRAVVFLVEDRTRARLAVAREFVRLAGLRVARDDDLRAVDLATVRVLPREEALRAVVLALVLGEALRDLAFVAAERVLVFRAAARVRARLAVVRDLALGETFLALVFRVAV